MKENIQIYILSRDRPDFLKEAIDSALNQNYPSTEFEIIISDNSESDSVEKMIIQSYPEKEFKYVRRRPSLSSEEHFQLVVSELNSRYAVLFHDDDILYPNYIKKMLPEIRCNNNIAAVGCNATIFEKNPSRSNGEMCSSLLSKKIDNEKDFLMRYLPGGAGIAPYPSYMYCTKYLKHVFLNNTVKGKHADVAILSSLLNYGVILWLAEPLMYYRVHSSNDSVIENIPDRLSLLRYMKNKGVDKNSTRFILFRVLFWKRWIGQQDGGLIANWKYWRYRTVALSILLKILRELKTKSFWGVIFRRYCQ